MQHHKPPAISVNLLASVGHWATTQTKEHLQAQNNQSFNYLDNQNTPSPRQARWMEKLSEYNFKIRCRRGSFNVVASTLSCRPGYQPSDIAESTPSVSAELLDLRRKEIPEDGYLKSIFN
jgi:hypothetical protein